MTTRLIPRNDLQIGMFVETIGYKVPVGARIVRISEVRNSRTWGMDPVLHLDDNREPLRIDEHTTVWIRVEA